MDSSENKVDNNSTLTIQYIDSCSKTNGINHNTKQYEIMKRTEPSDIIVRRGQAFILDFTYNRPYNKDEDTIAFIFKVRGETKWNFGSGSLVMFPLTTTPNKDFPWSAVIMYSKENYMRIQITSSAQCIVGKWYMEISAQTKGHEVKNFVWPPHIYIIFNPWCDKDQVYLYSEEWREEAILEENSIIWTGTYNSIQSITWQYGQFQKDILDCALYLITTVGKVRGIYRNDAIIVTRALSAAVNSNDDEGVVYGNWSNDFSGGVSPFKWNSSVEILSQYYRTKTNVKYGQCWVFAGVLTTLCRALGIPARSVTCFASAHDTESSLTIDKIIDKNGKLEDNLSDDSIWTFHVWTEVWMARSDLPEGYGGWQVVDATPQELSDVMYKLGPSSVRAVKEANIQMPYDTAFVFSEVNADLLFWKYSGPNTPLKLISRDTNATGKFLSTKTPGKWERLDITDTYKLPENSINERKTIVKALKYSSHMFSKHYSKDKFHDIEFKLEPIGDIKVGQKFDVVLKITNHSKIQEYAITVILILEVSSYTGKNVNTLKENKQDVTIAADANIEAKMSIIYDDYRKELTNEKTFKISTLATMKELDFEYYEQLDFNIRKPEVIIIANKAPAKDEETSFTVHIENTLPIPLTKVKFVVFYSDLGKDLELIIDKSIEPGTKAEGNFKFTIKRLGEHVVTAKFFSDELSDVSGFLTFTVNSVNPNNNEINP